MTGNDMRCPMGGIEERVTMAKEDYTISSR